MWPQSSLKKHYLWSACQKSGAAAAWSSYPSWANKWRAKELKGNLGGICPLGHWGCTPGDSGHTRELSTHTGEVWKGPSLTPPPDLKALCTKETKAKAEKSPARVLMAYPSTGRATQQRAQTLFKTGAKTSSHSTEDTDNRISSGITKKSWGEVGNLIFTTATLYNCQQQWKRRYIKKQEKMIYTHGKKSSQQKKSWKKAKSGPKRQVP